MSKVIVTGATGFVGEAVVKQCIKNKSVDEVVVLTRKSINKELLRSPKVNMIIHDEFSQYPDSLLHQLTGAQGCIWTIGEDIEHSKDPEAAKKVGIGYTLIAAETFRDRLAPSIPKQPFRFVYCSVRGAERDQNAKLWVSGESRKIKGAAETGLFDIEASSSGTFKAFALRPGNILSAESGLIGAGASSFLPAVRADVLAKAFVKVCLIGADTNVLENADINEVGDLESVLEVNALS